MRIRFWCPKHNCPLDGDPDYDWVREFPPGIHEVDTSEMECPKFIELVSPDDVEDEEPHVCWETWEVTVVQE